MAQRKDTNTIIIHCADTPPGMDIGVKEIAEWHRRRGYLEIGYHYVIRRDGTIQTGRALDEIGAHALGHNKDSIGICLAGGRGQGKEAENNFTAEQFIQLKRLLAALRNAYPGINKIIGHNEVNPDKACPSFNVQEWLKTI